jgi:hypothetical protein
MPEGCFSLFGNDDQKDMFKALSANRPSDSGAYRQTDVALFILSKVALSALVADGVTP